MSAVSSRHARRSRSRPILVAVVLALATLAACRPAPLGPETARAFERARAYRDSLAVAAERAPRTVRDTAGLLSLSYLERARVGMGSPYRLIDFALNDPRLPADLREATGWAILAMVYDGRTYQVSPATLDSALASPTAPPGAAAAQLALIERTVRAERDPRVGEHAVRLAYAVAGAEGLVRSSAQPVPARVAAQLRDRALARADLLRLLGAARAERLEPLRLVPAWRLARRFEVERPVLATLEPKDEVTAMEVVPGLVAELRRLNAGASPADADSAPRGAPLLSPAAAARLAALPQVRALPPRSAVVVALAASKPRLVDAPGLSEEERRARARFVAQSTNDESMVAELARLDEGDDRRVAAAALWAAVGMRPFGQEDPWFPGAGGPSAAELRTRFGLASVSFDRTVPAEWRPYYRRLLAASIEDLRRVLPDFSVAGIGVHFGRQPLGSALAVHDPRTRTVFLPLGTSAGTLAHELAHDLDWQVAARRFSKRGEYSTDQAVREQRGRLAASLRGLTSATLVPPGPENQFRPPHSQRPTEVFASSVDWFVTAGLASMGRMNGYLSSVQDEVFTGFSDVSPPDAHGDAGEATVDVLGEMTALSPQLESWFLARYGRSREATAFERVRRVLELTEEGRTGRSLSWPAADASPLAAPPCVPRSVDEDAPLRAARRRAVELAAEAVARRIVARQGIDVPGLGRVAVTPEGVPAMPIDPTLVATRVRELRDRLLDRVQRVEDARSWVPVGGSEYRPYCE